MEHKGGRAFPDRDLWLWMEQAARGNQTEAGAVTSFMLLCKTHCYQWSFPDFTSAFICFGMSYFLWKGFSSIVFITLIIITCFLLKIVMVLSDFRPITPLLKFSNTSSWSTSSVHGEKWSPCTVLVLWTGKETKLCQPVLLLLMAGGRVATSLVFN